MVAAIPEISLPAFTDPVGFADALLDGSVTGSVTSEQLSAFESVLETGGLTALSLAVGVIHDQAGEDTDALFKKAFHTLVRQNEARIRELLATHTPTNPSTLRFNPDARAVVAAALGASHVGSAEARSSDMDVSRGMDADRQMLREQYTYTVPSPVVAYRDGRRIAVATSPEALETQLSRIVAFGTERERDEPILIANIHGNPNWRTVNFLDLSNRYLDKVAKIRTETDRLSARRFVGSWFDLRWTDAVRRIQDSRNILVMNVLEAALVQYNEGKISYGTMIKVIKALDIVIKQDPAADIRVVDVDSFEYFDEAPATNSSEKPEETNMFLIPWRIARLPKGVSVFGKIRVPLITP